MPKRSSTKLLRWVALGSRILAACGMLALAGCPLLLGDDFRLDEPQREPEPEPNDMTAPSVVSVTPGDGFQGVAPDVVVVVTFSEPMNRAAVEAAYASTDLPADGVTFSWSERDTVLRITPNAPLSVATGTDPDQVAPSSYTFELTETAEDVSGNALAPESVTFSVIREITQILESVRDRALTGTWRGDGIYGVADCEEVDTTVCMGDSISTGEPQYKGFVTFDLDPLASNDIGVSLARLGLAVSLIVGDPFLDLGTLTLEHVSFAGIGEDAFSAPASSVIGQVTTEANIGDVLSVDVLAAVNADIGTRSRSQFRFAFDTSSDVDGAADVVMIDWSSLALTLTYRVP